MKNDNQLIDAAVAAVDQYRRETEGVERHRSLRDEVEVAIEAVKREEALPDKITLERKDGANRPYLLKRDGMYGGFIGKERVETMLNGYNE